MLRPQLFGQEGPISGELVTLTPVQGGLPLNDLPSHCACGDRFNINHALTCKKGGFVAKRYD